MNCDEWSTSSSDQWPAFWPIQSKNPFEVIRDIQKQNKHPIFSDSESDDDELMSWREARTWIWNTTKVEKEEKALQWRKEFDEKYFI